MVVVRTPSLDRIVESARPDECLIEPPRIRNCKNLRLKARSKTIVHSHYLNVDIIILTNTMIVNSK